MPVANNSYQIQPISSDAYTEWIRIQVQTSIENRHYHSAVRMLEKAIFVNNITDIKLHIQLATLSLNTLHNCTKTDQVLSNALVVASTYNTTDTTDIKCFNIKCTF